MVDIPIVQSIGIDVCILFCILSISIVLYCGLLGGELAQLCYIVYGWYPYCPIHWNWCLYLVLHTFHIHCPLLWITRRWLSYAILCIYPYCPIGIDVCILFCILSICCPLLWITSRWVGSVMLYCVWLISLLSNPLELMFVSCFAYFPYPLSFTVDY